MIRAALVGCAVLLSVPAVAAQPNIIVIMTDDQDDASLARMPKVKARLKDGTRFVNSFVNYPLCSPSRATFMSGQFIQNHQIGYKGDENTGQDRFVRKGTIPQWLQSVGYFTGLIGIKAMQGMGDSPAALGFAHSATIADHVDGRYFDPTLDVNGTLEERPGEYSTDVFRAEANEFVTTVAKPYFLYLPVAGPHAPAKPAPRHVGACADVPFEPGPAFNEADVSDKPSFMAGLPLWDANKEAKVEQAFRDRCETLLSVDELAADLIDRASKSTCVFLTSDHGFSVTHRSTGKLLAAYEESIRVPLAMWGCGAPKGAEIDALVVNADLSATILDLAGAESGRRADGRSLLPLFDGAPWRTAFPIYGGWEQDGGGTSECVRTTTMIYCSHSTGEREMYDLAADPHQLENVAAVSPHVPALHALMKDMRDCSGNACWTTRDPLRKRKRR